MCVTDELNALIHYLYLTYVVSLRAHINKKELEHCGH